MDMFTWWPPQDLHLPSPSICREANLLSLVVLGVSALVTVWGVATPLKLVHRFTHAISVRTIHDGRVLMSLLTPLACLSRGDDRPLGCLLKPCYPHGRHGVGMVLQI